jgi:lysophospholipase L1-like esterase
MKLNILLSALALLILGSSIALNILLYNRARQYYLELNEVRLDPVGLNYYPVESNQRSKSIANPTRVVFFGDSRALGWAPSNISGYEFINRGISAQTSIQILQRFKQHVSPLQPDVIVIQLGINDLKTIGLFPDRKQAIVANCKANIERIVKEARNLGAVVVISTIFPAGEVTFERKSFWSDEIDGAVKEVNTYISTLAAEKIVKFDAFSLLADERGLMRVEYRMDQLHLNALGYQKLNQEFVPLLRSLKR